jgi:hypothetical protein
MLGLNCSMHQQQNLNIVGQTKLGLINKFNDESLIPFSDHNNLLRRQCRTTLLEFVSQVN